MIRSRFWFGALLLALALVIFGLGTEIGARSNYGAGWWGPSMIGGYGYRMGPWMMGPGAFGGYGYGPGPWMMGLGRTGQTPLDLTSGDVKNSFQRWLQWQANPRLKLGTVDEKDADTITADIVTADKDGLVERFVVNRHTGFSYPSEE